MIWPGYWSVISDLIYLKLILPGKRKKRSSARITRRHWGKSANLEQVLQENKVRQISEKRTFLTPSTHTRVYVSGGKKCSFFGKFSFWDSSFYLITDELWFSSVLPINSFMMQVLIIERQSIGLKSKSTDWFLYDMNFCHERVKFWDFSDSSTTKE